GKMAKATILVVEVDRDRIERKIKEGYCDYLCETLDEALEKVKYYTENKEPASIGLVGNCADIFQEIHDRGFIPDIVTDQTSAHDPRNGYVPNNMSYEEALKLRKENPDKYEKLSLETIAEHVNAMLDLQKS